MAAEIERLWREPSLHQAMQAVQNPFGDGRAAARITQVMAEWYRGDRARRELPASVRHGAQRAVQSLKVPTLERLSAQLPAAPGQVAGPSR
ncbi:MAG: hypothetical protein EBT33_23610 [Betaproteobacteria bacterium]|nr:hypothetical protein [Betaproteobacteria bacterium]